ncbi:MAG: CPBP family intramembrane metalloprotease [Acidimicrobiales bacterium]|jgi:membrane protease YdiL (CAAX protease family)|nr:CPBP family intramembrane metalloprotease [Acidimicrobiales bacterium]HMS89542.1 type II CAAX endopeptidase family protein [Acidimicrobiales bacterium]
MAAVDPAPTSASVEPRWGLGDAVGGWLIAYTSASFLGLLILTAFGYTAEEIEANEIPLTMVALSYPPLWLGFVGVPIWAAAVKGRGWVVDFRARWSWRGLPLAALVGLLTQVVVVPLVSAPMLWLTGTDVEELGRPARELSEKATSPGGVLLFVLVVAVGAPIAEELFFRGLLLRAFEKRFGIRWAVVGSSVVFGATHFQFLQFPALTAAGLVFAWLVVRFDNLWAAVVGHMAFNLVTVVSLVWLN